MRAEGIPITEIQGLLGQIQGIESVEVRQDASGQIEGIEIAIAPPAAERRVIRDVESALMSGLGIHIDHRSISIRRTDGEPGGPRGDNGGSSGGGQGPGQPVKSLPARFMQAENVFEERLRLESVLCAPDGKDYCDVTVRLAMGDEILQMTAREADSRRGRLRAAGRATVEAIAATLDDDAVIALEGVEEFSISEADGLIALLRVRQGRVRQDFYGAALIEGDMNEAAARAVLDAMNRYLESRGRNSITLGKGQD